MSGYETLYLEVLRKQNEGKIRQPFPHQQEAFQALSKTFTLPVQEYRGALLVLPTGGGKTFTSINWICLNILSQGVKVLWLAQSAYLIDQARDTFCAEAHNAYGRDTINIRVVSSSNKHANAGTIAVTDDVLICTTQTAISAYTTAASDRQGNPAVSPFRRFINSCKNEQLFIVIDEAHHTPAYGCRTLLLSLREDIKNLYILGLTATPMHSDKRISGWLRNIYNRWICYKANEKLLQMNKVLSVPKYFERATGMEFEVNDSLYDRLVNKHLDLPEGIIDNLARNQGRNNLIVSDYLSHKKEYGKTLIFADRWFQCEYMVEKLKERGVRAAAVYSTISAGDTKHTGTGRRKDGENRKAMQDFRDGGLEVLINVQMLTEGVDVPDVKTVMITRQTTSSILITQMIGRALRGEKAGGGQGKTSANIVFFYDKWKRSLPWADIIGGMETERPITQRRNPYELVSIQLVKLASADIEYQAFDHVPFITFIPLGFFRTEFTIAVLENGIEELVTFSEDVIAYEFNKGKYENLIAYLVDNVSALSEFAMEHLDDDKEKHLASKAKKLAQEYFEIEKDDFDGLLENNISKIIRHIAQNGIAPLYIGFNERDTYDMDRLAEEWLSASRLDVHTNLSNLFNNKGLHWHLFYKDFNTFVDAFYKSEKRVLDKRRGISEKGVSNAVKNQRQDEIEPVLTEKLRNEVRIRDKSCCLCCGKEQRKGVSLETDHILPVTMGGKNVISNLQTLCHRCNQLKGVNDVDYRSTSSPLYQPKPELDLYDPVDSDKPENAIGRIVNQFYHCKALCELKYNIRRSGKNYAVWEIALFSDINTQWLANHSQELLEYVHTKLGYEQVKEIRVTNG